jgi:hypothetical protein
LEKIDFKKKKIHFPQSYSLSLNIVKIDKSSKIFKLIENKFDKINLQKFEIALKESQSSVAKFLVENLPEEVFHLNWRGNDFSKFRLLGGWKLDSKDDYRLVYPQFKFYFISSLSPFGIKITIAKSGLKEEINFANIEALLDGDPLELEGIDLNDKFEFFVKFTSKVSARHLIQFDFRKVIEKNVFEIKILGLEKSNV